MRLVILPQAVRRVLPPLLNDFVALQKDVGLISVLGAVDAIRAAQIAAARTFNFTPYVVAALLFVLLAIPTGRIADTVAARPPPQHRVVTLIGASGSGKSTLLRCVDLLEEIDDGQVLLDGVDVADPRADVAAAQRRMGIVFQAFNLFPHMTALENVMLAPRVVHGVPAAEATARAHGLLRRVGLGAFADAYPDRLSGGQQQRVAIARALAAQPRAAAARRDHLRARPRARR